MKRLALLVVACALVVSSHGLWAQQQSQIQFFFSAVDASGKPVTDLGPADIIMTENGAPGKVVTMEKQPLPIKLTVAVDNGDGSEQVLGFYREGLNGLVEPLPADMEVTFITMAPAPRMHVRPTTDRAALLKGISSFSFDDERPRFSDTIVEYSQRIEKEFKSQKLNYLPVLLLVSTTGREVADVQLEEVTKAINLLASRRARVLIAITVTRPGDGSQLVELREGRQASISAPLAKATQGRFEQVATQNGVVALLPKWGKELADSHVKQANQYRVVIERPGGATGALNNVDIRLSRPNLTSAISLDGRFIPTN
jgi:hypothetical protein